MLPGWTLGVLLALLLTGGVAQAQGPGQGLPYDEEEAQSIDQMLMCPLCPAETIDQSQAQIAQQMRSLVREMLAQGAGREEILDFFVDRYGPSVLAAPPKSGVNLLVWILPVVGVLAALAGGFVVIRSMTARGGAETATEPLLEDGLEPYLEAIDRDLALPGDGDGSAAPRQGEEARGASDPGAGGVEPPREDGLKQDG
jgi:cytochrome c-type biogenesis protein CcmH